MNDFLGRLAERALGLAQLVRPLIPSVYTPPVAGREELPFSRTALADAGIQNTTRARARGVAPDATPKEEFVAPAPGTPDQVRSVAAMEERDEIPSAHAEARSEDPIAPSRGGRLASSGVHGHPSAALQKTGSAAPASAESVEQVSGTFQPPLISVRHVNDAPRAIVRTSPLNTAARASQPAPANVPREERADVGPRELLREARSTDAPVSRGAIPDAGTGEAQDAVLLHPPGRVGPASHPVTRGSGERQIPQSTPDGRPATPPAASDAPLTGRTNRVMAHEAQSAAQPTVRVTIGVIDVRAAAAVPGSAPEVPTRGPRLSLDAYLARRNGRRGE